MSADSAYGNSLPAPSSTSARRIPDLTSLLRVVPDGEAWVSIRALRNTAGIVFGGQLMAQALAAAAQDVEPDRRLHSFQANFLRAVMVRPAQRYTVRRTQQGRTYCRRDVQLMADGELAFQLSCSFKRGEEGPLRETPAPAFPPPDDLPNLTALADRHEGELGAATLRVLRGIVDYEVRPVDGRSLLLGPSAPRQQFWVRPLGLDPGLPRGTELAIAFLSDAMFNSALLMPHLKERFSRDYTSPTLNHAQWLHGPMPVDEWLFFDSQSPGLRDGCGVVTGAIYDRGGAHIATLVQESVFRLLPGGR